MVNRNDLTEAISLGLIISNLNLLISLSSFTLVFIREKTGLENFFSFFPLFLSVTLDVLLALVSPHHASPYNRG